MKKLAVHHHLALALLTFALTACGPGQKSSSSTGQAQAMDPSVVLTSTKAHADAIARDAQAAAGQAASPIDLSQISSNIDKTFDDLIKQVEAYDPQISDPDLKKQFDDMKAELVQQLKDEQAALKDLFTKQMDELKKLMDSLNIQIPQGTQMPQIPQLPQGQLPQLPSGFHF